MAVQAYGSITITDLLDTATYIYYSASSTRTASDWHITAAATDKYIGIYSGPPADNNQQPTNPTTAILNAMEIHQFVGEDGAPGAPGADAVLYSLTCTTGSLIRYQNTYEPYTIQFKAYSKTGNNAPVQYSNGYLVVATSTDGIDYINRVTASGMSTVNYTNIPAGIKFVRCNLHPSSSNTTTILAQLIIPVLTNGSDRYIIESSDEMIYKFYLQNGAREYSPPSIFFWTHETGSATPLVPGTDYDYELGLLGTNNSDYENLCNFFSRIYVSLAETEGGSSSSATAISLIKTIDNNRVIFDINNLNNLVVNTNSTTAADVTLFNDLQQYLSQSNYYLNFKIFKHNASNTVPATADLLAQKSFGVEFGTAEDMAQFRLTAASIQQLVGDSKLIFDANGLHIQNGAFDITDNETRLLEYDPSTHALYVQGSGNFTGTINAESGSFKGNVTADTLKANSGTIGGWHIGEQGLYSSSNFDQAAVKLLSTGSIYAGNITLGEFAAIEKYIKLGDHAILWNPEASGSNNYILEAGIDSNGTRGIVTLTQDGILRLGNITLNGKTSKIAGINNSWWIGPEQAVFNNIIAKGKIVTSVFEIDKIQTVGGAMVFKPSYRAKIEGNKLVLEDEYFGKVDNYIYIVDSQGTLIEELYQVKSIESDNFVLGVDKDLTSLPNISSIIDIGEDGDIIIGVNSNDGSSNLLLGRGLTISKFHTGTSNEVKVFLGDFAHTNLGTGEGYGLYSDNVYLKGSLTTVASANSYAGVNTLSGVAFNKSITDTSKIIFWAGSASTDGAAIQNAPFQVTEQGTIYAQRGTFEGAIISRSTIEGSEIRTAKIYGNGVEPSLSIYNAANAIAFYSQTDPDNDATATEVFSIGADGLKAGGTKFISFTDNGVELNVNSINTSNFGMGGLLLLDGAIGVKPYNIQFSSSGINFRHASANLVTLSRSLLQSNVDVVKLTNAFTLGNDLLRYVPHTSGNNIIGYDLYIS